MEPGDLSVAVHTLPHIPIFDTVGLVERIDVRWAGEPQGFIDLIQQLRPSLLYRESISVDDDTVETFTNVAAEQGSSAAQRILGEMSANLRTHLGQVHTLTIGFANSGILHGLTVFAGWWLPFVDDVQQLTEDLDAVLETERDQRIETLAQAVVDHPDFRLASSARPIAFSLATEQMHAGEVTAAAARAKEIAEQRLPDRVAALVAAGKSDPQIRAELGIGQARLQAVKAALERWNTNL